VARRSVRVLLCALSCVTGWSLAATALEARDVDTAQTAGADSRLEPPKVLLLRDSRALDAPALELLSERLNELEVQVSSEAVAAGSAAQPGASAERSHAALVVWLTADDEQQTLFIYDSSDERVQARRLERTSNPAADREELLVIACSTITALLDHRADPVPPKQAQPTTKRAPNDTGRVPTGQNNGGATSRDASAEHDSAAAPGHVALLLGYWGSTGLAAGQGWQNGASATLLAWFPSHLHAGLSYGVLPSSRMNIGQTEVEFSRHPVSLGLGLDARAPWRLCQWLLADVVLVVDPITRTTHSAPTLLVATKPASRWLVDAGARIGAALTLVSNVSLYGLLGGKLGLSNFDYVAEFETTDERTAIGRAAWHVELGLSTNVF
jgi:hypothetical protein